MFSLNQHKSAIAKLCKTHKVDTLYLFGSANTANFNDNSDVDFLVKFKTFDLKLYFQNYMSFRESLKKILNREIDLVEEQSLKNPVLIRSIEKNKQLIYG